MARLAFVDIEASGLADGCFPIEIGWALSTGGPPAACLIRPLPEWTAWEDRAEALHGISRATLEAEGQPPAEVVATMRAALEGIPLCVEHAEDWGWLRMLIEAAGSDWRPDVRDAGGPIQSAAFRRYKDLNALRREVNRRIPQVHRAAADAQRLRDLYRAVCR